MRYVDMIVHILTSEKFLVNPSRYKTTMFITTLLIGTCIETLLQKKSRLRISTLKTQFPIYVPKEPITV